MIHTLNQRAGLPLPISATAYDAGELVVRLSGAEAAVDAVPQKLGGERIGVEQATAFWIVIREHTDACFLSIKPTTPPRALPGRQLLEWLGALRWLISDADPPTYGALPMQPAATRRPVPQPRQTVPAFHPLPAPLMKLHRHLKQVFDPHGILSRRRLYPHL